MLKLEQSQRQKQKLVITQELKQAIQLLSLNIFELGEYLENEADLNIFLDVQNLTKDEIKSSLSSDIEVIKDADESDIAFISNDKGFNDNIMDRVKGQSLTENLLFQLDVLDIDDKRRNICTYIIHSLDNKGYLLQSNEELLDILNVKDQDLKFCIDLIQSFYPIGIGVRDFKERIILQLKDKGLFVNEHKVLLDNHLEDIAHGRINRICSTTGIDVEDIKCFIDDIKSCNPNITSEFKEEENSSLYIYPELKAEMIEGRVVISLIENYSPTVKINKESAVAMSRAPKDSEIYEFYKEYYDKAMFVVMAVNKRKENMLNITREIFRVQKEFLINRKLKPLKMEDVARVCEVSVSTVSRIVGGKYVETPFGIFSLKTFFKHSVGSGNGVDSFTIDNNIKEKIREIIDKEDKNRPLSDEKIAKKLMEMNFKISRRTVNKYRSEMNIPPASMRKAELY